MNRKKLLISLAMAMLSMAGLAADNLPALRVEGRNLVDANGKIVVLHGVMDTPNRYFNGWRWQQWKADYSEADIKPCLEYFSKQFSLSPTRSRVLTVPCSDCTWIHAGPTIRQRKQKTRQISRHSTWRAIVSISRNSTFLSSRML